MQGTSKLLKDWTLGEVKELCQSMEHCWNCELRNGETDCRVANVVRNCRRPMEWNLPEPRQLTEPELAICRAAGATRLTRGMNDEYVLLWGPDCEVVAKFVAGKFPSVSKGQPVEVPADA